MMNSEGATTQWSPWPMVWLYWLKWCSLLWAFQGHH